MYIAKGLNPSGHTAAIIVNPHVRSYVGTRAISNDRFLRGA